MLHQQHQQQQCPAVLQAMAVAGRTTWMTCSWSSRSCNSSSSSNQAGRQQQQALALQAAMLVAVGMMSWMTCSWSSRSSSSSSSPPGQLQHQAAQQQWAVQGMLLLLLLTLMLSWISLTHGMLQHLVPMPAKAQHMARAGVLLLVMALVVMALVAWRWTLVMSWTACLSCRVGGRMAGWAQHDCWLHCEL
jgi:hypothetical protein